MRTLTTTAKNTIAQKMGTKPITIVGIEPVSGVTEILYSDKIFTTPDGFQLNGKLLSVSPSDDIVNITLNATTTEIQITFDDTDGAFKAIFDANDLIKKTVTVYQYFEGMNYTDKFVVFRGQIFSDVNWDEGSRSFSVTVVSKIQDNQIGFAPVQGQFGFIIPELAGQAWPLVFGDNNYSTCVKIMEAPRGVLENPIGFVDPTLIAKETELGARAVLLMDIFNILMLMWDFANFIAPDPAIILEDYLNQIIAEDDLRKQANTAIANMAAKDDAIKAEPNQQTKQNLIQQRRQLEQNLMALTVQMQAIMQQKATDEHNAQLAQFEYNVKSQIVQNIQNIYQQQQLLLAQILQMEAIEAYEATYTLATFNVFLGERFPQNQTIDLIINNMRIRGSMNGRVFTPTVWGLPEYSNVQLKTPPPDSRLDAFYLVDPSIRLKGLYCLCNDGIILQVTEQVGEMCIFQLKELSPTDLQSAQTTWSNQQLQQQVGTGNQQISNNSLQILQAGGADLPLDNRETNTIYNLEQLEFQELALLIPPTPVQPTIYTFTTFDITTVFEAAPIILLQWMNNLTATQIEQLPDLGMWYAEAGSTVYLADDYSQTYVVNLLPSTIVDLYAYRTVNNKKVLTAIPHNYYSKNENNPIGPFNLTTVTLYQQLSDFVGEQWEDTIYASISSSVGPNTVDILEYLITTYGSGITYDATSFSDVKAKIDKYPSHFGLYELKEVVQTLQEIAWQARCGLYIKDNVFFIKYLSEKPTSIATITESDIEPQSLKVGLTQTENVYTKFVATWQTDKAQPQPNKLILQHNVAKYGLIENDYDFYIYNIQDLVLKSATYWMIMYSNTWKLVSFKTFLNHLDIETMDTITLDFATPYVCNTAVDGLVQKAEYDSDNNVINVEVWIPVKAGEMDVYDLAHPSSVSTTVEFPTPQEVLEGMAGGGPPGNNVAGTLTAGGQSYGNQMGFTGSFRPGDWGLQFPSDANNTKPNSPLGNGVGVGNPNAPVPQGVKVGANKVGNPFNLNAKAEADLTGRQAFIGVILEKTSEDANGRGVYTVLTDPTSGAWVTATQVRTPQNYTLVSGMGVIVVRSHLANEWLIQGQVHFDWVKRFQLKEVFPNMLKCEDDYGNTIYILKPWNQSHDVYDGEFQYWQNLLYRHYITDNWRYASTNPNDDGTEFVFFETLVPDGYYINPDASATDKTKPDFPEIIAVQLEDAITDNVDGIEGPFYWVALNNFSWKRIDNYYARLNADMEVDENGAGSVEFTLKDPDLTFSIKLAGPNHPAITGSAKVLFNSQQPGYKYFQDDYVLLQVMDDLSLAFNDPTSSSYGETIPKLYITKHYHRASWITGTLTADLNPTDATFQIMVTDWNGGYDPSGPDNDPVTIDNTMGFKSDNGKLAIALLRDDGTYEAIQVQCSTRS